MSLHQRCIAMVILVTMSAGSELVWQDVAAAGNMARGSFRELGSPAVADDSVPITVRPATLAAQIDELAGHLVRVPYARVVGMFNPRVFVVDTASRLPPLIGNRNRVLVLAATGPMRVPAEMIVASTVTVAGVARTLVGMQVSGEVAWPTELRRDVVERLEIRAAVLATSVRTADGIELIDRNATEADVQR